MGISCISCSSADTSYTKLSDISPNPNKYIFEVKEWLNGDQYDVLIVTYPGCTTFEGDKIILVEKGFYYPGMSELDPHFFEGGKIIARFKPTPEGLQLASKVAGL